MPFIPFFPFESKCNLQEQLFLNCLKTVPVISNKCKTQFEAWHACIITPANINIHK